MPERTRARLRLRARCVIALMLAGALAAVACGRELRPNVLLISIDTLRADHLKAYGYERETAPSLTRLAEEGARFSSSYAQSSSTVPTHASLFTGRYPFQHGSYHVGLPVPDAELTLAEILSQHGYRTFAGTTSIRFRGRTGFEQGFEVFDRFDELEKNERGAAVTDRLLAWIDEGQEPWFAFVHYFGPHQPYAPPEPYRSRWHPGLSIPKPEGTSEYLYLHNRPDRVVSPEVLAYLRALYDGEIRYLDVELERLFAALTPATSTLVVVTSDHGEEFKEHGGLSHAGRLHEELLRVPLLVWWPGQIAAGTQIEALVETIDVLPTVLELVGAGRPEALPGRSFGAELLAADGAALRDGGRAGPVLSQLKAERWALAANVSGSRFKLVSREQGPHRLYDLSRDPGEQLNLIEERPDVAAELRALAARMGVSAKAVDVQATGVSPEIRARLREIGYVEEAEEAAKTNR